MRFFVTWCGVCAPLRDYDCFFLMIFHPPFAKEQERAKKLLSLVFCNKVLIKLTKNAGIYHEQTSERAELHVRAVRVVQSVDVRHSRR